MRRKEPGVSTLVSETVWRLKDANPDPLSGYYGLLTELVSATRPKSVLELGTLTGASAGAILAALPREGTLTSIDITPRELPKHVLNDARFRRVIGDSRCSECYPDFPTGVDFLFIDTDHTYDQAKREWEICRPWLNDGAIACFDDIHFDEGMARFWHEVADPKWDTGADFHHTGFGIAFKAEQAAQAAAIEACNLAVAYVVHDDHEWFELSLKSVAEFGRAFVFVNRRTWTGGARNTTRIKEAARRHGATVVEGDWVSEEDHRQKAYRHLLGLGFSHALVADTDEVFEPGLLAQLKKVAEAGLAELVHVEMDTYWHSPEYVVRPREPLRPCVLIDLREAFLVRVREFAGGRRLVLGSDHGVMHHLSYCGSDERIKQKTESWSHRHELVPGWWEEKWLGWQDDHSLRDLHPTRPVQYSFTERIKPLEILRPPNDGLACQDPQHRVSPWPTVSVVIPLYGGRDDISLCLQSLERCRDLLHEVIVVDNASPDLAGSLVQRHTWMTLIQNQSNRGFAGGSNQGYEASTGEVVLFLNSDTIVPRAGLTALIEDLLASGVVAAAGPVSNMVGHNQMIGVTYTSVDTVDLFALDLAASGREPRDTDMLVGFCLAARRSVLKEVGVFDETFGDGLFEDNDLCYRMRRAGYRLIVSQRAFVHHKGSATIERSGMDYVKVLRQNGSKFEAKWARDIETGFASHLSGLANTPIAFDSSRKPEGLMSSLQRLVRKADVSLCMIVRDEERVIGACLQSGAPFFNETIVVDTGSKDKTVEIARSLGAQVYSHPWEDSFAAARNHSLSYAKGKWVFWMDADDTLPWKTGEALLQAAVVAPPQVGGFIVPVQFVEEVKAGGTRVDHVKLVRRCPGLQFEGRIHEQVIPSVRKNGGELARLDALVLHSGYDKSPEGQAKKRARDRHLLKLDYFDRPTHPFPQFNLGMTHHYLGHHRKAVRWLRKAIKSAQDTESQVRKAYDMLAMSLAELGEPQAAMEAIERGLQAVGEDAELRFHAGLLSMEAGDFEAAVGHFDKALAYDPVGAFHSFDVSILGFRTRHNRAHSLLKLGRYMEARADYLAALEQAPEFLPSATELFDAATANDDWPTARRCRDHVLAVEGPNQAFVELAAAYVSRLSGSGSVLEALEALVSRFPRHHAPRLRLAQELGESGRIREADWHLSHLRSEGLAQASYLLGVSAVLRGDLEAALAYMLEALARNPGHGQTISQVRAINRALGRDEEDGLVH